MRAVLPYVILSTLVGGSLVIVAGLHVAALVAILLGLAGLGYLVHDHYLDKAIHRRRITPDGNGLYPIDSRQLSREVAQHVAMTIARGAMVAAVERARAGQAVPTHYAPKIDIVEKSPPNLLLSDSALKNSAETVETTPALPSAPTFAQLLAGGFHARTDRMLLGYGADGPIYGGIDSLLSTAIAGRPGQGKSTTLRMVYAQCLQVGADVMLLDPHGSIAGDVDMGPSQLVASTGAELDDAAAWLTGELDRRLTAYRAGERSFRPLLVMADEMPVISLSSKAAVQALGRVVLEARKVGGYALISGQGLPASNFGGRLVRDALSSRIIHRTSAMEGMRAGLDKQAAQLLEQLRPGYAVLDGPVQPQIVAIPLTMADDLAAIPYVPALQPEALPSNVLDFDLHRRVSASEALTATTGGSRSYAVGSTASTAVETYKSTQNAELVTLPEAATILPQTEPMGPTPEAVAVPEGERLQIVALAKAGISRGKICEQLYGARGGRGYSAVKQTLDTAGL